MRVENHVEEILQESFEDKLGMGPDQMGGKHIRRKHRTTARMTS
jgi:hypothetical protein